MALLGRPDTIREMLESSGAFTQIGAMRDS